MGQFMKGVLTVGKLRVSKKHNYPVFTVDTSVLKSCQILSQSYETLKNGNRKYNTEAIFLQVLLRFGNV